MIDQWLKQSKAPTVKRIWAFSDLQQSEPAKAEACLKTAVEDIQSLQLDLDYLWYLGDATEGDDPASLQAMCEMHLNYLRPLDAPLRYVLGNHDFDYFSIEPRAWFAETVRSVPGWRTTDDMTSFYYTEDIGPFLIVFLSDHGDPEGRWHTTHGVLKGKLEYYPHLEEHYEQLKQLIADSSKPVIMVSHYAFAGSTRPSHLHGRLLPLPPTVRMHLHGHAHIGDARWAGKDAYRKFAGVDHQHIPQFNISSLENGRGSSIRSALIEIYEDTSIGIFFRDHSRKHWSESVMLGEDRQP